MRIAYADPPYPGCAHLYKDHPDYGGEVDHVELLQRLEAGVVGPANPAEWTPPEWLHTDLGDDERARARAVIDSSRRSRTHA